MLLVILPVGLWGCRYRVVADGGTIRREDAAAASEPEAQPTSEPTEAIQPEGKETPTAETPEETQETVPVPTEADPREPTRESEPTPAPSQDGTLATEAPVEVWVTLNPNKGTCQEEQLARTTGQTYGELPPAVREGFLFTGWYFQKNGGTAVTPETVVTLREDHTLYAHWTTRPGSLLTFDPMGGRIAEREEQRMAYAGEPYGELPVPVRRGYEFLGWFTRENQRVESTDLFTGTENQTLYAQWEYDPYEYWSFRLENITQQIYACQFTSAYVEYDTANVTSSWSGLLSATGTYNIAQNLEDGNVTDQWVQEKMPALVVKIVSGSLESAYGEMTGRFPGYRVVVLPAAAEYGSPEQILYYRLYFGKLLYPDWYTEVDITTVGEELGVSGYILG